MARTSWVAGVFSAALLALSIGGAAKAADTEDAQPNNDAQANCGTPSCAACADGGCCQEACRAWEISADAVFLQRASLNRTILLQPSGGAGTNASAANASDFKFDYDPGLDVSLVRKFSSDGGLDAVDVRYLGVFGSDDSFQTFLPTGDNVPFRAFQPFGNGAPQNWNLAYRSNLNSLELNTHYELPSNLTFLAGARWVQLDEHLLMDSDAPSIPQAANFDFGVRNDLVGLQLGLRATSGPAWGRWRLDGAVKAGVYDDFARNSFSVGVNGAPNIFTASDSADHVAFVGELQVKLQYAITNNLCAEIGYQTLWIDGVAIASNQIAATDLNTHSGINTSGHAFYQGGNVGLNLRF